MSLSSEAWDSGIRKGMPLSKAMRRCRNAVVVPPNESLYLRASRAIFRVLESFSPVFEPSGHGHVYLDITGTGRLLGPPRDTAWKTQKEIRRQLHLDTSLGVASNKMVSKIASEVTRPDGLQDVPHGGEHSFLSPLPVHLLPGVGPQTEGQLKDLNIRIIHDIAVMRLEHLALAFGRFGFVLHQRAQGIDRTPVNPLRAVPVLELEKVLPEFNNQPNDEKYTINGYEELEFYPGKKDGKRVGTAIKTYSDEGFSERIRIMVGFDTGNKIINTWVVEQKETPGLGTKMKGPKFRDQFKGKDPVSFKIKVKKDGGEVDAITAATITSRAFCEAVERAYMALTKGEKQ